MSADLTNTNCFHSRFGTHFPEMPAGKLMLNLSNVPGTYISVDFIMGLPEAHVTIAILLYVTIHKDKSILFLLQKRQLSELGHASIESHMELHGFSLIW